MPSLIPVLLSVLLLTAPVARAQAVDVRRITLEEALGLFAQNNLELHLARLRIAERSGLSRQAAVYPNPSATLTHEPLWRAGDRYSETYVTLSQRIEWPDVRRARVEAAGELVEAAYADFQADSVALAFEVIRAYAQAAAAEELVALSGEIADLFHRADRAGQMMIAEGEVSGYSLRRIRVERARYENGRALAELELQDARRRLALLVLPEGDTGQVAPAEFVPDVPGDTVLDEALERALSRRAELRSARAEVASARAELRHARREQLPQPVVTAGYKRQLDGFGGAFLGLSAALPVFDRNHGAIEAREARLHAAETRLLLAERRIEADVRRAYGLYASLLDRGRRIADELLGESDALLRAGLAGYAEGQTSLVELLDAAEAYYGARSSMISLHADVRIAYFDLVRAAGGFFSDLTSTTESE